MDVILDILIDAGLDTLKLLPFLFLTYLAMEYLEHRISVKSLVTLQKAGNFGPLIGGVLGAVPQCGFSAAASGLYAGHVISLGTLMAVYLSTSDEMLPILISEKAHISLILSIIGIKAVLGIVWGFLTDLVLFKNENAHEKIHIHSLCEQEHCNCNKGILGSSIKHTLQIALFIFAINLVLGAVIEFAGVEALTSSIFSNKFFGPVLAAFIGLIPNCAASVAITRLYLEGVMNFGALLAGLLSGAGVGWLILLRASRSVKKTVKVVALLLAFGIVSGLVANLFF